MIALMATIKDKPEWNRKVFDDEIVGEWRREALDFGKDLVAQDRAEHNNNTATDNDDEDGPYRINGESVEFDGSQRQKLVSERMFDYVSYMRPYFIANLIDPVYHGTSRGGRITWQERHDCCHRRRCSCVHVRHSSLQQYEGEAQGRTCTTRERS